jgi:hypothetical protein
LGENSPIMAKIPPNVSIPRKKMRKNDINDKVYFSEDTRK